MASSKSSTKKRKKLRIFSSLLLILIGASLLIWTTLQKFSFPIHAQRVQTAQISQNRPQLKPLKLYIPRLAKVLYISDGYVKDNRWTISETGVSYLKTSALPGSIGNSVIYGHNKKEILGALPTLSIGDRIYITTENGEIIRYEVVERKQIKPTQVEILDNSKDSRLTIYTCSGFLDQSRYVVIAKQIST